MQSAYHEHERVQLHPGVGMTKQSFAEESNINLIMKKYEKTGLLEHFNQYEGRYGDFINYADYHSSMNLIREADEAFMTIPASVRAKFNNDPAKFLEFAQDEKNIDELIEMGLARATPKTPEVKSGGIEPETEKEASTTALDEPKLPLETS